MPPTAELPKNHNALVVGIIAAIVILGGAGIATLAMLHPGSFKKEAKEVPFGSIPSRTSVVSYPVQQKAEVLRKPLDQFPVAATTWKTRFPVSSVAATGTYQAFYFDTRTPTVVRYTERSPAVAIRLGRIFDTTTGKEAVGNVITITDRYILPEKFGGYWIGSFSMPEAGDRDLAIAEGNGDTRVIIDGRVVYEGSGQNKVPLHLPSGTHTMEVEHVGNGYTANFSVYLVPPRPTLSTGDLAKILAPLHATEVWYAGTDYTLDLHNIYAISGKLKGPTILFLSSGSPVSWDLSRLTGSELKAVVVASKNGPVSVTGYASATPIYATDIAHSWTTHGSCYGPSDCSQAYAFSATEAFVREATGGTQLTGYAGSPNGTGLTLPGTVLTPQIIEELRKLPAQTAAASRSAVEANKPATVNTVFP
ncbi:MAG: hypothetical protein JWO84_180 [Parcubacteria group bacterium]|nr:hypothetical protein [Parcubacteria group bacterium]